MQDLKKYTILIVDDDADLRAIMSTIFEERGFTILTADCGTGALEVFKSNKINLILTDMRMPNGDGLFLLEKIRELDPKNPPIIFVTGYSDISENEFIAKGAAKVFTKPFDRRLLVAEVKRSLGL